MFKNCQDITMGNQLRNFQLPLNIVRRKHMFKNIPGHPDYSVNENGEIKSNRRNKLLTSYNNRYGYVTFGIRKNKKKKIITAHQAVALTFIPNPENKSQVNHKDGNKKNNHISNLEWATPSENIKHAFDNGLITKPKGELHGKSILTEKDVILICERLQDGWRNKDIAEDMNINIKTISNIRSGHRWDHISKDYNLNCKRQNRLAKKTVKDICELFSRGFSINEVKNTNMFQSVDEGTLRGIYNRKYHNIISKDYKW